MLMKRLYPVTKFSEINTLEEQLEHIKEEFREVVKAEGLGERDEELADLEHSIQTYFDMRAKMGVSIDNVRKETIEKNRKRGYYQK